ncbi:MAG: endonuclease V [Candidatus Thorarchaeota archaeon]
MLSPMETKSLDEDTLYRVAQEQYRRASEVVRTDVPEYAGGPVTGVDVAYSDSLAVACAVTIDTERGNVTRIVFHTTNVDMPYVPGFFQLREGPVLIEMLRELRNTGPVLIDGNGVLHPRRFGLASYVGVELGIQTIGVAKTLLLGTMDSREGDIALVRDGDDIIGAALWIGARKKPVYVSIGNRVSLATAIEIVRDCSSKGRVEPIRQAHIMARTEIRKRTV